jgi:hypothetical protein
MLPGDDVFDVKIDRGEGRVGEVAILAPVAGSLANDGP